jgi:hypothetical protein
MERIDATPVISISKEIPNPISNFADFLILHYK